MDYSQLSVERLHELFSYRSGNKSKPLVRNIDVTYNAKKGDRPGVLDSKGYLTISIDGKRYRLHRVVFFFFNGYFPEIVDHMDGDKLNNRISNLRQADSSQNNCNAKIGKNNTSGIKGVSFSKGYWLAQIMKDGKRIHLYSGKCKDEAVRRRLDAERIHGEFSNNVDAKHA